MCIPQLYPEITDNDAPDFYPEFEDNLDDYEDDAYSSQEEPPPEEDPSLNEYFSLSGLVQVETVGHEENVVQMEEVDHEDESISKESVAQCVTDICLEELEVIVNMNRILDGNSVGNDIVHGESSDSSGGQDKPVNEDASLQEQCVVLQDLAIDQAISAQSDNSVNDDGPVHENNFVHSDDVSVHEDPIYEAIDGLDPDSSLSKMAHTSRNGQWKNFGYESADDILVHIKKCKCSLECPILDCRYFSRVPDEWPATLPEDEARCRYEHSSQLELLMHASEYGCDYREGDCRRLGCRYTEALLKHAKYCREEDRCDVPKCWYFRQLRAHFEVCITNFRYCALCTFYKGLPPEPRSHMYLPMFL